MISGIAGALGLGGSLAAAGSMAMVAWYVWRASTVGSAIASTASSAAVVIIGVTVTAAAAIALGWVSPRPGIMLDHIGRAVGLAVDRGAEPVRAAFRFVMRAVV